MIVDIVMEQGVQKKWRGQRRGKLSKDSLDSDDVLIWIYI